MKKHILTYIGFLIVFLNSVSEICSAAEPPSLKVKGEYPTGTILNNDSLGLIGILSLIQWILLKVVLPIVVVGGSLYIAYELFTAEGDETKMKRAWKSVTFTAIGIVCIAVSYAFVSIVSRISL
jgi:hypothetical protein